MFYFSDKSFIDGLLLKFFGTIELRFLKLPIVLTKFVFQCFCLCVLTLPFLDIFPQLKFFVSSDPLYSRTLHSLKRLFCNHFSFHSKLGFTFSSPPSVRKAQQTIECLVVCKVYHVELKHKQFFSLKTFHSTLNKRTTNYNN